MIPSSLPWTIIFRWGAIGVLAVLLLGAGFKCGMDRGDEKLEAKAQELMVCSMDRTSLSDALHQVNAKAEQAKRDAAAQAKLSADLVELAKRDRRVYDATLGDIAKDLEAAKRAPACRIQLEAESCASFR